jgi:hypothetical protein
VKRVRLKIDISGTVGSEAWEKLKHFPEISSALFSPEEGTSGTCEHAAGEPHRAGEWCGAVIEVESHLLAEYAVAHYLEQPRVTDAYMDECWEG